MVLHFVQRLAAPSAAESENFLFQMAPREPVTVSLFSGGLDSLAGLPRTLWKVPEDRVSWSLAIPTTG